MSSMVERFPRYDQRRMVRAPASQKCLKADVDLTVFIRRNVESETFNQINRRERDEILNADL